MSNQKKGLHPLAWVAIGCGVLAIGVVTMFAVGAGFLVHKGKEMVEEIEANPAKTFAETAIKLHPEYDLVTSDEVAGTLTFREKKTGDLTTLDYESIREGKFEITNAEGTATIDMRANDTPEITLSNEQGTTVYGADVDLENVPEWVPDYPNITGKQGTFSTVGSTARSGLFTITTSDSVDDVLAFFQRALERGGYTVESSTFDSADQRGGTVGGTAQQKTLHVMARAEGNGGTTATVQYEEALQ